MKNFLAFLMTVTLAGAVATAGEMTLRVRDIAYTGGALNGIMGSAPIEMGAEFTSISGVRLHLWGRVDSDWTIAPDCPAQVWAWFDDAGEFAAEPCFSPAPLESAVPCTYGVADWADNAFEREITMGRRTCWSSWDGSISCRDEGAADFGFLLDGQAVLMLSSLFDSQHYCGKALGFVDSLDITVTYDGQVTTEDLPWGTVKSVYR